MAHTPLRHIFVPTSIRYLKAEILEVHNGFIHHDEKKLPVFWYLVKVFFEKFLKLEDIEKFSSGRCKAIT